MKWVKITNREQGALNEAWYYLNNVLEACTGNKQQLKGLKDTMSTLSKLHKKIKNQ